MSFSGIYCMTGSDCAKGVELKAVIKVSNNAGAEI